MPRCLPNFRVLVWGAKGFIGRALVEHLTEAGASVRVLTRPGGARSASLSPGVEWVENDDANQDRAFDRALDGITVVFNLAGSSGAVASNQHPLESLESNCRVQLEFLAACARTRRRPHIVFASSRLVYAAGNGFPITEDHPVAPLSMYAAHKLCVEHYHRIFALRDQVTFTICRISNPFGLDRSAPGKGYGFINALIQRALAGQRLTLFGGGRQLRDYLYIDDLARSLRLCGERVEARNEVLNVGFGSSLSILDAATRIQRALGGGAIDVQPWPKEYEAVESGDFVVDTTKLRRLLGWAPAYSFDAGLACVKARALSARLVPGSECEPLNAALTQSVTTEGYR